MSHARVDHVFWLVRPENVDGYVSKLVRLFGAEFDVNAGDQPLGGGSRIFMSYGAGLELVAPQGKETELAQRLTELLEDGGERAFGLVLGVPDMAMAVERLRRGDVPVGEELCGADRSARKRFFDSWTDKVKVEDGQERFLEGEFLGIGLLITEMEFRDAPVSYATRTGRLDRVCWLVKRENIAAYAERLGVICETEFEQAEIPDGGGDETVRYVAWDAGLELIAPVSGDGVHAARLTQRLAERGEGLYSLVMGTEDIVAATEHAERLGVRTTKVSSLESVDERRAYLRSWTDKVDDVREAALEEEFVGVRFGIAQIAYRATGAAPGSEAGGPGAVRERASGQPT